MITTFNSFLNEGKSSWGGMQFTVTSFVDRDGMYISFIPRFKMDSISSHIQQNDIYIFSPCGHKKYNQKDTLYW